MTLREIKEYLARFLPAPEIVGDESLIIENLAKIEDAAAGDITFLANPKYEKFLETTQASAIIVSRKTALPALTNGRRSITLLKVDDAYTAFVFLLEKFAPPRELVPRGIHPSAVIEASARIHPWAHIGAGAYIGEYCYIGENTVIAHNAVVLDHTHIGDNCKVYPNVTIYDGTRLGDRVTIHAGSVIGSDGFGFAPQPDGSYKKIPQTGIVCLEDDVEIGACVTIDRATLGETVIRKGTKIDNLVQIAHNVDIGADTVVAAQAGISGSTTLGKNCMIAGQVGIVGHIELADRTVVGAQSGVSKSHTQVGETLRGSPAQSIKAQLKQEALMRRLEDSARRLEEVSRQSEQMLKRIAQLETEIAALKQTK